jgi:hypothetical protein
VTGRRGMHGDSASAVTGAAARQVGLVGAAQVP